MKYEVIKEFQYIRTGIDYEVGEIFETDDAVNGLIHRGIIRIARKPAVSEVEECPNKSAIEREPGCESVRIEEKLNNSKEYEIPKPAKTAKPSQNGKECESQEPFDPTGLEQYKPAKQLERAKTKSNSKVLEAVDAIGKAKTRKPKQVEMTVKMTELVEEVSQAEEKAIQQSQKARKPRKRNASKVKA